MSTFGFNTENEWNQESWFVYLKLNEMNKRVKFLFSQEFCKGIPYLHDCGWKDELQSN